MFWTQFCAASMERKCRWRNMPASSRMSFSGRCRSTDDGTISAGRESTSPLAAAKRRNTWKRSKRSSTERSRPMKSNLLTAQWQQLPREKIRQLQGQKLRRYLRDVVVPFSAHYREVFHRHGLNADAIRAVEDLEQIPFTSKADLLNTPDNPHRSRDFLIIPE